MVDELTSGDQDQASDLVVEIADLLDAHGLPPETYTLYDVVNIEALEQLRASPVDDMQVTFTVDDIRIRVTQHSVDVLLDRP